MSHRKEPITLNVDGPAAAAQVARCDIVCRNVNCAAIHHQITSFQCAGHIKCAAADSHGPGNRTRRIGVAQRVGHITCHGSGCIERAGRRVVGDRRRRQLSSGTDIDTYRRR